MADTRINALSTATSSASDDFVPIDGTTNGTRKLNAFSPTFGGNATVGGTLSTAGNPTFGTSGNTTLTLGPTGALYTHYIRSATAGGAIQIQGDPATGNRWVSLGHVDNASSYTEGLKIDSNAIVRATGTTASTSTSTGALVVGNGTSGGLGVGGAVTSGGGYYFGASADASLTRVAAGVIALGGAATSRIDINGATDVGIGFRQTGVRDWFVAAKSAELQTSCLSAGSIASYESGVLVRVRDTTASTSTSSGALVVGNGTSGGLGVGGSVNVGGSLTVSGTSSLLTVANSTGSALLAAFSSAYASGSATPYVVIGSFSDPATSGARIAVSTDYSLDNRAAIQLQTRTTGGTLQTALTLANTRNATFAADVAISGTTASTSTSSGALVVSGGVGVAKEVYVGGGLLNVAKGGAGATIEINADSGFASKLAMQRAATNRWTLEVDSSDVLTLKSLGTTAALTMTGTTSAEFVGSIKTAAPSGGTAANWKLGTVASVSPTSPNRTIEVDIGGTIYYIHAKTTNN